MVWLGSNAAVRQEGDPRRSQARHYVMHTIAMACAGKGKPTQAELDAREVREAYDPVARELRPIGPLALVGSTPPPKRWVKLGRVKRPDVDAPLLPGCDVDLAARAQADHAVARGLHRPPGARAAAYAMARSAGRELAVIAKTVEAINAWNDRTQVIETPEREAVCTAIDDIGRAAGLRGRDLAGPYRDW